MNAALSISVPRFITQITLATACRACLAGWVALLAVDLLLPSSPTIETALWAVTALLGASSLCIYFASSTRSLAPALAVLALASITGACAEQAVLALGLCMLSITGILTHQAKHKAS